MNDAERSAVVKCLTDMLQVLETDTVSAFNDSLSFQNSVSSWKDAMQSLPAPGSVSAGAFAMTFQRYDASGHCVIFLSFSVKLSYIFVCA